MQLDLTGIPDEPPPEIKVDSGWDGTGRMPWKHLSYSLAALYTEAGLKVDGPDMPGWGLIGKWYREIGAESVLKIAEALALVGKLQLGTKYFAGCVRREREEDRQRASRELAENEAEFRRGNPEYKREAPDGRRLTGPEWIKEFGCY